MKRSQHGRYPAWVAASLIAAAIIVAPYYPLILSVFSGGGENWEHVRDTVLSRYLINTVILVVGTGSLAVAIGTAGAWILERWAIPARGVMEVLFLAPLALPVYISTFTWGGMLGFGGTVNRLLGIRIPFAGWPAAVVVMALGLYPYVYLTVRASLMANSRTLFEVVASLSGAGSAHADGAPRRGRFEYAAKVWRGIIPSLRPAMVGGGSLVVMEVMNEYATPVYLGVETLSTGVFRTWFGLGDLSAATRLAAIVLAMMVVLLGTEQYVRGRRRFTSQAGAPPQLRTLSVPRTTLALAVLIIPSLGGFLLPVAQLIMWTVLGINSETAVLSGILLTTGRTIGLATAATVAILAIAVLIAYVAYLRPGVLSRIITSVTSIGYAVPGTVVAIGVLAVFRELSVINERLFLFGTIAGLIFAYAARYLAVGLQPVQSAFARQHRSTIDAARSLGSNPMRVLYRIVLPLFRPTLLGAALMLAIDIIKDLPMTLLLRPFDFDTLAVQTYRLASDERLAEAAPRALLLVAIGILTIAVIMRPSTDRTRRRRR